MRKLVAVVLILEFLAVAPPANAEETSCPGLVSDAIEAVVAAAPELLSQDVNVEAEDDSVLADAEGISVEVPLNAAELVTLTDSEVSIGVELPYGDLATPGVVDPVGLVAFDNLNSTSTVTAMWT